MKPPEHRAAARMAWRSARLAKGRTALILFLIALPVLALAGAGFAIKTAMATPDEVARGQLGSADMTVNAYSNQLTTQKVIDAFPAGTRVSYSRVVDTERVVRAKRWFVRFLETSVRADRLPVAPRYALIAGRMPSAPGEVAIHPDMRALFGVGIGGRLILDDVHLDLRVVGIEVTREDLRNVQALVAPGTFGARKDAETFDWLIDLSPGANADQAIEAANTKLGETGFLTRADIIRQRIKDQRVLTGAAFGIAVVAMFGTTLIAAAAFGVGARRQLRTLGLVGAAGGEPRHVRATVLWGGAVLGAVGSAIGVVIAIVVAVSARAHMSRFVHRIVPAVRLPWLIIAGGFALGTIAATMAALGPARQAARMAGRSPAPRPPGKLARRGLFAVAAGSGLIALGTQRHQDKLLAAALVVTLAGFLLAIPLLVTWVGRAPSRLPTSLRLAARQTARYGRRTGTAVAAATLALTAPVAIAAYTLSDEAYNNAQVSLGRDMLVLDSAETGPLSTDLSAALRRAIPGSVVALQRYVLFPPSKTSDKTQTDLASVDDPPLPSRDDSGQPGVFSSSLLVVGDETLLRAMHAEQAIPALEAGRVIDVGLHPARESFLHDIDADARVDRHRLAHFATHDLDALTDVVAGQTLRANRRQ